MKLTKRQAAQLLGCAPGRLNGTSTRPDAFRRRGTAREVGSNRRGGIVNLSGLGTFVTAQSVVSRWSQRAVTVRHTEKDRDRKNR